MKVRRPKIFVSYAREDWEIKGADFFSKAKITPFEGRKVKARPTITVVGGRTVYRNGEFQVGKGIAGAVPVRKRAILRNT